jgi:DCN1-like protein 1/2
MILGESRKFRYRRISICVDMTNKHSKEMVEFITVSGASEEIAMKYLSLSNGSLNIALELFYADGIRLSAAPKRQRKTAEKDFRIMFRKYASNDEAEIGIEGIETLAADMGKDPLDVVWLIFALRCEAKTMGVFTEEEFVRGLSTFSASNAKELASALESTRDTLPLNRSEYDKLYGFVFEFALDPGARNLPLETAVTLWKLLVPLSGWSFADEWLKFIETGPIETLKAVTRDSWGLLLKMSKRVYDEKSLKAFDKDEGAWPLLIDDFYDYLISKPHRY